MAATGGVSVEQFESYFQRADLDRDGRISGAEAVAFFRGSNLPQDVLAKIWTFADQNRVGFLGRPEFYNALKLVTVAQSKRELTPDIVKAALYGPASSKIPPPQINLTPVQQNNFVPAASPQLTVAPTSQTSGYRGQVPSGASISQQFALSPLNASGSTNQYYGQAQPSSATMNSQFGQINLSNNVVTQLGQFPAPAPGTGFNPQFGQVRLSSDNINSQFGTVTSKTDTSQSFGYMRPSSNDINQQYVHAQPNQQFLYPGKPQQVRPPVSMWSSSASRPRSAVGPIIPQADTIIARGLTNSSNNFLGGERGALSSAGAKSGPSPVPFSSNGNHLSAFPSAATDNNKGFVRPVQNSTSDPYSANKFLMPQSSPGQEGPPRSFSTPVTAVPETSGQHAMQKRDPFEALQSNLLKSSSDSNRSLPKPNQQVPNHIASSPTSLEAIASNTLEQPHESWQKMTNARIQKYAKVFMEVDTGRLGRITGEQARKLFLSWKLPREVLKQVWDLSDQDNDSMLSLREFCIALYFMERYREGKILPSTLPQSVMLDEALLSLAGPPVSYGNVGWNPATGVRPAQGLPGVQPFLPTGLRPPTQKMPTQPDGAVQSNQQNAKGISVDNFQTVKNGKDNSLGNNGRSAEEIEKAENDDAVLLDSREKLEYYRTKMQDLVLYKSRCDNRLNEIMERARSDKAEAEALEKKYQEKYKQVAEVHSKLTLEEASFREIQERKTELHHAINKIEHGGSADGILQVRADRIQSDLEGLLKALSDRCKKHDLQIKSSTLIELPPGWEPGVPETALIWDEEWDKFDDEGFSFDVSISENTKLGSQLRESSSPAHSVSPDSVLNGDSTSEKPFSSLATAFDAESVFSADESKSVQGSPGRATPREVSKGYTEDRLSSNSDRDADTRRSFDEPAWGSFNNDDDDFNSAWAFNSKDSDHERLEEKNFFGSDVFAASPERSASPQEGTKNRSALFFEDSAPSSPRSRAANSPSRASIDSKDPFFDSFSRYDPFHGHSGGSPLSGANLARFDSSNSTSGFSNSSTYSFDDSDPFGSSGPFKVLSDTPKKSF